MAGNGASQRGDFGPTDVACLVDSKRIGKNFSLTIILVYQLRCFSSVLSPVARHRQTP